MIENEIAERVRTAILEAAVRAYEDAGVQGLCAEGRWEVAVSAMRSLDLTSFSNSSDSKPRGDRIDLRPDSPAVRRTSS